MHGAVVLPAPDPNCLLQMAVGHVKSHLNAPTCTELPEAGATCQALTSLVRMYDAKIFNCSQIVCCGL